MKILHCCESIESGGGIASFVANLTYEQSVNHNVAVTSISRSINDVLLCGRVSLYKFNKESAGFSIKYPVRIFKYLMRSSYDIVHIHSAFLYYALAVIFLHNKFRFVYTIHSDSQRENSSRWDKIFFWLKRLCFKKEWMHPITISPSSQMSFYNTYKVDSYMIFNGIRKVPTSPVRVDMTRYKVSQNTRIFIHPGRISEAKNQVVLCEAFSHLIRDGYDVVLLIAGLIQDNQIFDEIKKYFSNRIIYLGQRSDVLDLLKESDAMCLSSIWEGLPITLLESMSVGCVPICSSVGGIVDVVTDGYNGILSPTTDVEGYYSALKRFMKLSPNEISMMRQICMEEFNKYDISKVSLEYITYYESLRK